MRSVKISVLSVVAICLALASSSRAGTIPIGTLGLIAGGPTITNTGDVTTATVFTIPNFTSAFGDGVFAGEPVENLGTVTLDVTSPTSFVLKIIGGF